MPIVAPGVFNEIEPWTVLLLQAPTNEGKHIGAGLHLLKVFVPSDLGGTLELELLDHPPPLPETNFSVYHEGTPPAIGITGRHVVHLEKGKRGDPWYFIVFSASGPARFSAKFLERGLSRNPDGSAFIPWNFWFYPFSKDEEAHSAWSRMSELLPLVKFELVFEKEGAKGAVDWEKKHHNDPDGKAEGFEGHCQMAAAASILFEEPFRRGMVFRDVIFWAEELKFLAAAAAGRYGELRAGADETGVAGTGARDDDKWWPLRDPNDVEAKTQALHETRPSEHSKSVFGAPSVLLRFLTFLRKRLREAGQALMSDLRDVNGAKHDEVWNHAVFQYETCYWQKSAADLSFVDGKTTLYANADMLPDEISGSSGLPAKVGPKDGRDFAFPNETCVTRHISFRARFTSEGRFDFRSKDHEWLSTRSAAGRSLHAPRYLVEFHGLRTTPTPLPTIDVRAHANPYVDFSLVKELVSGRILR